MSRRSRHARPRRRWLAVVACAAAAPLVVGTLAAVEEIREERAEAIARPAATSPHPTPPDRTDVAPAPRPRIHRPPVPSPIPGYLLIADRGNDRAILVGSGELVLWTYPRSGTTPSMPFNFDDDTFFGAHYTEFVSNQEAQQTIEVVSFPKGRAWWSYGHVDAPGSGAGYLNTPDDAYLLRNGLRTVADVRNCRVVFISPSHAVVRQYGTTGVCEHDPPRLLSSPNGDTPIPGGGTLITEINGSWIDAIGPHGDLMWAVQAPVAYPSDAQWLGHGKVLLADYSSPGHVLIMTKKGRVLWEYGPDAGPGELDHPSLALRLPNGLIAVNDDYRHRVVLIDPHTDRIVWQYGHTDAAGADPGYLDTPDGMDFLPFRAAMSTPSIRRLVLKR